MDKFVQLEPHCVCVNWWPMFLMSVRFFFLVFSFSWCSTEIQRDQRIWAVMWLGCGPDKVRDMESKHRGGPSFVLDAIRYSADVTFWLLAVDPQQDPIIIEASRRPTGMGDLSWSWILVSMVVLLFLYPVLNQDSRDRRGGKGFNVLFHVRAFSATQH
jgi:hypothetical protein